MGKKYQAFSFIVIVLLAASSEIFAQRQWLTVGAPGFSTDVADYTSLAIDNNGAKYVAYSDAANGNKSTVKKFDGVNWQTVGNTGFSIGAAYSTSIAVDNNNGTPYVAYQDVANGAKATVMKYNGTNWLVVGGAGFSSGAVQETKIAVDNMGTPYIAFGDSVNNAKATVMKFDGTSWVNVGAPGFSAGAVSQLSFAIDNSGIPYVAYTDQSASNAGYVMKYNGTNWVVVHHNSYSPFSNPGIVLANIAIGKNDTPFIAYHYHPPSAYPPYVKKFGTWWAPIGYLAIIPNIACLALDSSGIPYVAVKDTAKGGKMSVVKYDGAGWVFVGDRGFSTDTFGYTSMLFDNNNVLNVVYQDGGNSKKVTMMAYDCPSDRKLGICGVVADTVVNRYVTVVWDSSGLSSFVDSYRIHREDNGTYTRIGSVPVWVTGFTDVSANPSAQSYRYKLTYLDKCGREMVLDSSIAHKSVKLVFNYLIDGKASLTWNRYEGISNPTYTVMRSNNIDPFMPIANFSISGADTTYIDANPPSGNNRYRIDIELANPCKMDYITFDKITSNTVIAWKTEIKDIDNSGKIMLMPNPASNELKVKATETLVKMEIFGLAGNKLLTDNGNSRNEWIIDISSLPAGMYFLKINEVHKAHFIKR